MSNPELESDTYDVIVIGTGLAESIAAAALAKVGKSVLHLDPNEYYGSEQASLTLDELAQWASTRNAESSTSSYTSTSPYRAAQSTKYTSATTSTLSPELERDKRRYALSLFPSILPSRGSLISTLIASGVSKYISFRLLESVSVWDESNGGVRRVPGSKEEVFKDKSVGLVEKRRLMKFLMWAVGEFEGDAILVGKEEQPLSVFLEESFQLTPTMSQSITYAIAHCSSSSDPALPALLHTRRYLKSLGRYGVGAFLIGQYGGAGEIAQGFCRACAVAGGTYVLGPSAEPESIDLDAESGKVTLKLPCHPRPITASHIISSPDHLPSSLRSNGTGPRKSTAHCIAVLASLPEVLKQARPEGQEEGQEDKDDTAVILFPEEGKEIVRTLMMGEGTGSCPAGQYIVYLSTTTSSTSTSSPTDILQPYLTRLDPSPLFESYYLSHRSTSSNTETEGSSQVVVLDPYSGGEQLTEGLDWEAEQGEAAFWAVKGGKEKVEEGMGFFERKMEEGEGEGEDEL